MTEFIRENAGKAFEFMVDKVQTLTDNHFLMPLNEPGS